MIDQQGNALSHALGIRDANFIFLLVFHFPDSLRFHVPSACTMRRVLDPPFILGVRFWEF